MTSESTTKKAKRKAVDAVPGPEPKALKRKKSTAEVGEEPAKKKKSTAEVGEEVSCPCLPTRRYERNKPAKKSKKDKKDSAAAAAASVPLKRKATEEDVASPAPLQLTTDDAPKPAKKQKKAKVNAEVPPPAETVEKHGKKKDKKDAVVAEESPVVEVEDAPKLSRKQKKAAKRDSAAEKDAETTTATQSVDDAPKSAKKKVKGKAVVEDTPPASVDAPSKSKTTRKKAEQDVAPPPEPTKKTGKTTKPRSPSPEPAVEGDDDDDAIHGFTTDDEDSSDDDEGYMDVEVSAADMAKLPTIAKDDATVKRKLENAKRKPTADRGVLFLGRIPHGFYEEQAKAYFSQFGTVTRLRVSRNKKTGKSKHYGFIEFDSSSVAQIVAETMDNYLLMGHIMQCKVIPKEKVHPELWLGANRKWRPIPKARVAQAEHNKPRTKEQQLRVADRLIKRQDERQKKLAKAGIEYDVAGAGYIKA
ncbi:hypothetical protein C8F01DRAFT_571058 [Mycena amicta]|nr:hypothetical protein C8F01DRAFT_571058 [Mycena amicta]